MEYQVGARGTKSCEVVEIVVGPEFMPVVALLICGAQNKISLF
jgi:hypothetical protein